MPRPQPKLSPRLKSRVVCPEWLKSIIHWLLHPCVTWLRLHGQQDKRKSKQPKLQLLTICQWFGIRPRPRRRARIQPRSIRSQLLSAWLWIKPIGPAFAVGLAWFAQEQFLNRHLPAGLWLWLFAAFFVAIAFWQQPDQRHQDQVAPAVEKIGLALIVLAALFIRLWQVKTIPNGYFFDEAMNALLGLQILQDPAYVPIFGPGDAPAPTLYFYLNAVALKLGGVSAYATKVLTAILGSLTVAMFYFLMRRVVSMPVALAAAGLLAVMRWHVNFSRINFIGICTPLFGAAAVYFLLRGLETRNRWHMALSGLAVSLGLYTYYASNLIPFVIGPYLVLQLVWDREFLKKNWTGLLAFLGIALLVFAPLGYFAFTHLDSYLSRNNQVLIFRHVSPDQAWSALVSNIRTTLLMFNYFGDTNGRHNLPEAPMLDPVSGILFGLGLAWALLHLQRRHAFLALSWFLIALVPGFLTIEAPQGYRCLGAIIPVAMLSAMGLERLWQSSQEIAQGTWVQRYLGLSLIILLSWIGYRNLNDYFGLQAQHAACWSEFSAREAAIGNTLRELGPGYHAYISSAVYNYPTIRFLGYPHLEAEAFQMFQSIPSDYVGEKNLAYMLLPIHDGALELLRYYYPPGREKIYPSPYDYVLFTSYLVNSAEVQQARGLQVQYQDATGKKIIQKAGADGFNFSLHDILLVPPLTAQWQGSIRVSSWNKINFQWSGLQDPKIYLDGKPWQGQAMAAAQGMHTIRMRGLILAQDQNLTWCWKSEPYGVWEVVPGTALSPQTEVHGLLGTYWRNEQGQGLPMLQRVDPLMSLLGADFPLSAPFSARWQGRIKIPRDGHYQFGLLCNQYAWLYIDGKRVVENKQPDSQQEGEIYLRAGFHSLQIDYQKLEGAYPRLVLYWTVPGQAEEKVPYLTLSPENINP